jgi:mannose-1-phosphate guanylyltransferase
MRALLLAAGIGSRLRPVTDTIPKCLVPIHGRALLDYWFDILTPGLIDPVLVNTHYLPDAVRRHLAAAPYRDRVTLVHEDTLLGTGGTVHANAAFLRDGPFLVAHADNLTRFDIGAFIGAHERRPAGCAITMLAFETDDPRSCGILETATPLAWGEPQPVLAFHEKVENPPGTMANAAVYILEPEVLDFLASLRRDVIDLSTQVIPHFIGRIQAVSLATYHRDIGNVESLRRAHEEFTA